MRAGISFLFTLCMAAVFLGVFPAGGGADVLTLDRGNRLEGIVTAAPGDPEAVLFRDSKTRAKIARSKIKSLDEEPDAVDWRRIGDQYFSAREYEGALEAYRKSLEFDANDARSAARLAETQTALAQQATLEGRRQMEAVDKRIAEIDRMLVGKDLAAAEEALAGKTLEASSLGPEQAKGVADLRKRLYKARGLEMEDKLQPEAAAGYYEKLLEVDPLDEDVFARLVAIWDKNPAKTPAVIDAYRVRLKMHPEDPAVRGKLASKLFEQARRLELRAATQEGGAALEPQVDELYSEALGLLEQINRSDRPKQADAETQIVACLNSLYRRAEQRQDYDRAIELYKRLQTYSPEAKASGLNKLAFQRDVKRIDPRDADARTTLVLQARAQGLEDEARQEMTRLRKNYPGHPAVQRLLTAYAGQDLARAQQALATVQYEQAVQIANQLLADFPELAELREPAEKIVNLAGQALERERRLTSDSGRRFKEIADNNYNEGLMHVNALRDKQVDDRVRVVNDKQEAIRCFSLAIENYDRALQMWTNIDAPSREEIRQNRADAARQLGILRNPYVPALPRVPSRTTR